jgi:hypothetical protein
MKKTHKIFLAGAALVLGSLIYFTPQIQAQKMSSNVTGNSLQEDIFRVLVTLFGIKKDTGYVVSFVKVDDITTARLFNATKEDMQKDNDGIVGYVLSFPNQTVATGAEYKACVLVLNTANVTCESGYNSPGPRTEMEQIVIE